MEAVSERNEYLDRRSREIEIYKDQADVHMLPDIFHYWSNKHLLPMEQELGFNSPDDFFIKTYSLRFHLAVISNGISLV